MFHHRLSALNLLAAIGAITAPAGIPTWTGMRAPRTKAPSRTVQPSDLRLRNRPGCDWSKCRRDIPKALRSELYRNHTDGRIFWAHSHVEYRA